MKKEGVAKITRAIERRSEREEMETEERNMQWSFENSGLMEIVSEMGTKERLGNLEDDRVKGGYKKWYLGVRKRGGIRASEAERKRGSFRALESKSGWKIHEK